MSGIQLTENLIKTLDGGDEDGANQAFIPAPGGFQGPRDGYIFQNGEKGVPSQAARKGLAVLRARFQPAWTDKDHEKGGGFDGILHMELLSDDNRGPQRQRR